MCNQRTVTIVTSTIILVLLLVATALLVYHYVFSPQIENTNQLKVLSELPQYNNVDFDTCKCQHFEENCATKIEQYASLNIQKEEICTQDKVLCCKLKENSHWNQHLYKDEEDTDETDEGEQAAEKEIEKINVLELLLNKLSLSKVVNSSNCKCQNSEAECVKQVHIPQFLQLEMVSVCPYPNIICCNIEDDVDVEKEILNETNERNDTDILENRKILDSSDQKKNKLNESNLYLNSKLNQNLEILTNFNEINEDLEVSTEANLLAMEVNVDLPETYLNKSEKAGNDLSIDNVYVQSHKNNSNSHQDISNQNLSNNLVQFLKKSIQLYDTDETLLHSAESEINVKNSTNNKNKIHHLKDININQIANILKYADFNSKINITDDILNDINMLNSTLSMSEQGNNSNTSGITLSMDYLNMLIYTLSLSEEGNNSNPTLDIMLPMSEPGNNSNTTSNITLPMSESGNNSNPTSNITLPMSEPGNNFNTISEITLPMPEQGNISNTTSDITLPMHEQGNSNASSGTLYTPDNMDNIKSKPLFDHLFYYTYLGTFLYVLSYLTSSLFLIPVFSVTGMGIMQFIVLSFPQIINSHILDIISPVLKTIYGLLGVL